MSEPKQSEVIEGRPASAESEFWIKLGEKLIGDSLTVYDKRSQQMIISCGALATLYLAVLRYLEVRVTILSFAALVAILPEILLLIATLLFAVSLLPIRYRFNRINPEEVKRTYIQVLDEARVASSFAYAFFILAVLAIVIVSISSISGSLK